MIKLRLQQTICNANPKWHQNSLNHLIIFVMNDSPVWFHQLSHRELNIINFPSPGVYVDKVLIILNQLLSRPLCYIKDPDYSDPFCDPFYWLLLLAPSGFELVVLLNIPETLSCPAFNSYGALWSWIYQSLLEQGVKSLLDSLATNKGQAKIWPLSLSQGNNTKE